MGWFWGSSGDDKPSDPLAGLDPSLRAYLEKESPVKYPRPSTPVAPKEDPRSYREKAAPRPGENSLQQNVPEKPIVPRESLFQDGRYAHLWKTYQPQQQVEEALKSDQEKLLDIVEGYKYRKAEIGRAALENCAMEQWEVNDCFRSGSWASRMTMCRDENHKLDRCYNMQAKFLKALGYLSTMDRSPEVDEQIQMHADTLYHRMLDQEKAIEEAKAAGQPVPTFAPLIGPTAGAVENASQQPATTRQFDISKFKPDAQEEYNKRLEGLTGAEREVEEKSILGEIAVSEELTRGLGALHEKKDLERKKRLAAGHETFGDKLRSFVGLDK